MGFVRKHKIVSGIFVVLVLLIVIAAAAGSPKTNGSSQKAVGAAPKAAASKTAASKTAHLPENAATTDPRWFGLGDCLTAHGIQDGPVSSSLDTYGMVTSSGNVIGNITYSRVEQFKYGPISWTFATDPAPAAADKTAVTGCIDQAFGPGGLKSEYVKKYASPAELNDDAADRDPRWAALRKCLTGQGLRYFYEPDFPSTLIVKRVGVVDYGKQGPGTLTGPVKYILDTTPAPSTKAGSAFLSCLHQEY